MEKGGGGKAKHAGFYGKGGKGGFYHPKRKDFTSNAQWYGCTSVNCKGLWADGLNPPSNCYFCGECCSYTKPINGPYVFEKGWKGQGGGKETNGYGKGNKGGGTGGGQGQTKDKGKDDGKGKELMMDELEELYDTCGDTEYMDKLFNEK